jgi:hypothetical protein
MARAIASSGRISFPTPGASPRRTLLSTAGWIADFAAHGARRIPGREPEAAARESLGPDSFHWPASGRAAGGPDSDTVPVPKQALAVDL